MAQEIAGGPPVAGDDALDQVEAGVELRRRGAGRCGRRSAGPASSTPKTRMKSSPQRKSGIASDERDEAVDQPFRPAAAEIGADERQRRAEHDGDAGVARSDQLQRRRQARRGPAPMHVLAPADRGAEIAAAAAASARRRTGRRSAGRGRRAPAAARRRPGSRRAGSSSRPDRPARRAAARRRRPRRRTGSAAPAAGGGGWRHGSLPIASRK